MTLSAQHTLRTSTDTAVTTPTSGNDRPMRTTSSAAQPDDPPIQARSNIAAHAAAANKEQTDAPEFLIDDNQQCYICHETANRILQVTKLENGQYDDCGQYECCDRDACYTYIKNRIFCHAMIAGMEMLEADVYAAAHTIRVTRKLQS